MKKVKRWISGYLGFYYLIRWDEVMQLIKLSVKKDKSFHKIVELFLHLLNRLLALLLVLYRRYEQIIQFLTNAVQSLLPSFCPFHLLFTHLFLIKQDFIFAVLIRRSVLLVDHTNNVMFAIGFV